MQENWDAFVSDLMRDPQQTESKKMLEDFRKSEDTNRDLDSFFESLEIPAPAGRSNPEPRLRSEREPEPEITWRPGDDPNFGLEKDLAKRHEGTLREPARIEKSASGWTTEYAEDGSLLRAYGPGISREVFAT